jgi:hypothetical protein
MDSEKSDSQNNMTGESASGQGERFQSWKTQHDWGRVDIIHDGFHFVPLIFD